MANFIIRVGIFAMPVRLFYDYGYNGAKGLGHGKDDGSDGQKLSNFAFQNVWQ